MKQSVGRIILKSAEKVISKGGLDKNNVTNSVNFLVFTINSTES